MSKINISIELEDNLDNFLKLLPLNIRNKYMSNITSAVVKQNEKMIIDNIAGIVQDILQVAIAPRDEVIIQSELDKALEKLGVIIEPEKKKIKGKKNSEGFVKKDVIEENIETTIFTKEVTSEVENIKSIDNSNIVENKKEVVEQELPNPDKLHVNVKELGFDQMFLDKDK